MGALKQYEKVSENLIKNKHLVNIAEDITNLRKEVFTVFSASSGMGKTQTALALLSYFQKNNISAFYMLHTMPVEKAQMIYQCFEKISFILQSCLEKDYQALRNEWNEWGLNKKSEFPDFISYLTMENLSPKPLYLFGFVKAVLDNFKDKNTNLPTLEKDLNP